MKKHYLFAVMCLAALSASAESNNVALTCKNVTASYTSGWNNLYSVNNGTKGFGMDLPNEETWGCYISTAGNQSEQYITYTWDLNHRLESATVYFWSDAQSGSGVAVPESWEILYLDENGEWQEVTLLDGEQYGLERFEANSAAFVPVETRSIRLLLHAQLNGSNYSAMGVNEWEVYGECIEKEDIDPNAKVSVATYASSIEATYTSSWNNLNSINNGTKGFGMDLPNNETWGCWQNPNAESQSLTYWWEDDYSIDSVSVYFWSDSETGTGVVVPQSWFIEYYDNGNWIPVTLIDGEVYGTERLEANHVKFNAVSTYGLRLTMNAYQNEDGSYAAIGVNEWEVYSEDMGYAQKLIFEYNTLIEEINSFEEEYLFDVEGLLVLLEDSKMEYEVESEENDIEKIQNNIEKLTEALNKAKEAYKLVEKYDATFETIEKLLESENFYPGIDELLATYDEVHDFVSNGYGTPEEMEENYNKLVESINTYHFSQLYSVDEPADYSFLGKSMQFIIEEAAPYVNDEGMIEYPNASNYTDATQPSDSRSTGWYLGETDGDQQVRWQQQRMCWYACKTGASELTINQNLTGLPSGYYAVSAEMITMNDHLNGQHIFAKTSAATTVSPNLSIEGWDEAAANSRWERLTTDKILVFDGKLTIGAAGPGDNLTDNGMFCATNFILYYYGTADADNIEALYAEKLTECQNECNIMTYAADRKQYQDIINANSNATGFENINAALKALNSAQVIAQRSIRTYNQFLVGPYNTLSENIENGYTGNTLAIAKSLKSVIDADNASDDATYKNASVHNTIINYIFDNYMPTIAEAEQIKSSDDMVISVLQSTIAGQVSAFANLTDIPTTEEIDEMANQLLEIMRLATISDIIATHGSDYTILINNPTIETTAASGWTISNENGDGIVKTNSHFDGKAGNYLNSYNANAGTLNYTASQTIVDAPNGTYRLQAMMRVAATPDAEGVYLFACADDDTKNTVFASAHMQQMNYTKYFDILAENGGDSIAYVSDIYGSLWEEASTWLDENQMGSEELYEHYIDIYEANSNCGYGWQYVSLEVEVKNHTLTLGVTTDYTLSEGATDTDGNACVPFSGTWFSADNFTLTLLTEGDNSNWSPATGITSLNDNANENSRSTALYNLQGLRVNANYKGIVIKNGKKYLSK